MIERKVPQIKFTDILIRNKYLLVEMQEAIFTILNAHDFIQGKAINEFEKNLGTYLGVENVIGVGNGTDALQIALLALGLRAGDEVILPSFTYYATAEAVAFLGMIPVLVDVDIETFTILPEQIENAITQKTKAIIPKKATASAVA